MQNIREKSVKSRRRGSTVPEFGASFVVFVIFVLVPLMDLGIIPVRYMAAYSILNILTHQMSVCDKVSQADQMRHKNLWWKGELNKFGIHVANSGLSLKIVSKQNMSKQVLIPAPAAVPAQWQPDSPSGPFFYYLELSSDLEISPLFHMGEPWSGLPGLTGPAKVRITTDADWENLSRDSESPTEDFFINE